MSIRKTMTASIALCGCIAICLGAFPAIAQEMQRACSDEKLAKVREWEKTWAGMTAWVR